MSTDQRFTFPGFVSTESMDSGPIQVEHGKIEEGGHMFYLRLIRHQDYSDLPFTLAEIYHQGKLVWNFKTAGYDGIARLAMGAQATVIALCTRGRKGKVERIVPLCSLIDSKPVGMLALATHKVAAARFLQMDYITAQIEVVMMETIRRQEADAKVLAHQTRMRSILAREQVAGFTSDGVSRRGIPVLEEEWRSLGNNTWVILVDSIGEDGIVGEPLESFYVVKERSAHPRKGSCAALSTEKPLSTPSVAATLSVPNPIGAVAIQSHDMKEFFKVDLYPSMEVIRQARSAGLNGGTYVAVDERDAEGRIQVLSIHSDKIVTVGSFEPLG